MINILTEVGFNSLVFAGLFGISAFFSGSETALMAVNRFKIAYLARTDGRAKLLEKILKDPDRLIGTLLLCNNLVNVALSAMGTAIAIRLFGDRGVLYATFVITLGLLIFGEITPKTIAAYHATPIALRVSPVMRFLISFCYPCVRGLTFLSNAIIRLLRLERQKGDLDLSEEELQALIESSGSGAGLEREKQEMLIGVLLLDKTTLGDIMVPWRDVVSLELNATLQEVLAAVEENKFSRYPVYEKDPSNVVGFVHVKDLLLKIGENQTEVRLKDVLMPPPFAPESRTIRDQLEAFRREQLHMCFVVDEYGQVVGLVTLEDVLEEIVGEIEDEHDSSGIERLFRLADGSYLVDGSMLIRDINRRLGLELPENGVRTVAGLIISRLDRFPDVGEVVSVGRCKLQVVRKRGFSIEKVRIQVPGG